MDAQRKKLAKYNGDSYIGTDWLVGTDHFSLSTETDIMAYGEMMLTQTETSHHIRNTYMNIIVTTYNTH